MMKKQKHRQRPNQKKQREKSTQRVTSANRRAEWSDSYPTPNALHGSAMALALGSALMGAASVRDWAKS
jgi:hypothetical protein